MQGIKVSENDTRVIRQAYRNGESARSLAGRYQLGQSTVLRITQDLRNLEVDNKPLPTATISELLLNWAKKSS